MTFFLNRLQREGTGAVHELLINGSVGAVVPHAPARCRGRADLSDQHYVPSLGLEFAWHQISRLVI